MKQNIQIIGAASIDINFLAHNLTVLGVRVKDIAGNVITAEAESNMVTLLPHVDGVDSVSQISDLPKTTELPLPIPSGIPENFQFPADTSYKFIPKP